MGAQQTAQDTAAVEAAESEAPNPPQEAPAEPEAAEESRYPARRRQRPTSWWEATPRANVAATTLMVEAGKAAARNGAAGSVETAAGSVEEPEPATYKEAMASKHAAEWRTAMDEEMASLHTNQTWELEDLPAGAKAIPVKWVFKVKKTPAGVVERYKARLVAKGYHQREGVDFDEAFAPVSKHTTLRALLAKAAAEDLEMDSLDIKTAFLNGELEEEVYTQQPEGYAEGRQVCHLRKALYGLRQAPRAWHTKLKKELEQMGFAASAADPSLFVGQHQGVPVYLLTYVDDLLVAASSREAVDWVKAKVKATFDTRDLGEVSTFLGMSISRDRKQRVLTLSQESMVKRLVSRFGEENSRTKAMPLSADLTKEEGELLDTSVHPYSTVVGSLLYLAACTRPDIAQAVGALAKYMSAPRTSHWAAAKGVLRYLNGTSSLALTFSSSGSKELLGFCDADYAGDKDTRRSTTGYVFLQHGGAISWSSRRQQTVALSTVEAEYMAQCHAAKEAIWLNSLQADLGYRPSAVRIFGDNQGAIALAANPITSQRSKHIDVQYHFIRERVSRGDILLRYVQTEHMVADSLTKAVPGDKTAWCRAQMGLL